MIFTLNQLLKVQLSYTISGNRLSCNWHYGKNGSLNIADPSILGAEIETTILPIFKTIQSQEVVYESIYVTAVQANLSNPFVKYISGEVGDITEEGIPSNLAAVVQLRQNDKIAKHNGRIFVSGIPETEIENSLIRGSFISGALAAFALDLKQVLTSGGTNYTPCVVNMTGTLPSTDPEGYEVIQVNPTRALGTQRRRTTELRQFHP